MLFLGHQRLKCAFLLVVVHTLSKYCCEVLQRGQIDDLFSMCTYRQYIDAQVIGSGSNRARAPATRRCRARFRRPCCSISCCTGSALRRAQKQQLGHALTAPTVAASAGHEGLWKWLPGTGLCRNVFDRTSPNRSLRRRGFGIKRHGLEKCSCLSELSSRKRTCACLKIRL